MLLQLAHPDPDRDCNCNGNRDRHCHGNSYGGAAGTSHLGFQRQYDVWGGRPPARRP